TINMRHLLPPPTEDFTRYVFGLIKPINLGVALSCADDGFHRRPLAIIHAAEQHGADTAVCLACHGFIRSFSDPKRYIDVLEIVALDAVGFADGSMTEREYNERRAKLMAVYTDNPEEQAALIVFRLWYDFTAPLPAANTWEGVERYKQCQQDRKESRR